MKVLLILSDGMRPDAVENHPVIRTFRANGTYCMNARTVMPSVTLPCIMSLFHSVESSRHGITTNTYVPQVRPVPGLFEQLRAAKKSCAMFYNWEELRDLCRPGSLSRSVLVSGDTYGYENACRQCCDETLKALKIDGPDFAFLYLGWPDAAGHDHGWMSDAYRRALDACCDMVGELIRELGDAYTFIYTADHGGHDRTHGTDLPEDMTVPIFFLGEPFAPGKALDGVSILDIAPTVAALLGAQLPEEWEGTVIR